MSDFKSNTKPKNITKVHEEIRKMQEVVFDLTSGEDGITIEEWNKHWLPLLKLPEENKK